MSEPALIRRDGTVLGFDVGSRRIGVAIGSAFAAHAPKTLEPKILIKHAKICLN